MESEDWVQYIEAYVEATDGLSKPWLLIPWLLIQWWLKLRQDQRATLGPKTHLAKLHQASMNLGQWWQGQEAAVFGGMQDNKVPTTGFSIGALLRECTLQLGAWWQGQEAAVFGGMQDNKVPTTGFSIGALLRECTLQLCAWWQGQGVAVCGAEHPPGERG